MKDKKLCVYPKCKELSTYVAPKRWCDKHWVKWWVDGLMPTKVSELRRALRAILESEAFELCRKSDRNHLCPKCKRGHVFEWYAGYWCSRRYSNINPCDWDEGMVPIRVPIPAAVERMRWTNQILEGRRK